MSRSMGVFTPEEVKEFLAEWNSMRTPWSYINPCEHEPVQTGMTKSWCKHCDVNMRFIDGKYQVEG